MPNRGETREDHGNAKCTGQQRRERKNGGHYALPKTQLRRASPWESIHYLSRARLGQSECRFLPRCPAMALATPRCVLAGRLRHIGQREKRILRAGRRQGSAMLIQSSSASAHFPYRDAIKV